MSYIIRDYANWFLYVGLIIAGGLVFLVAGCDTGMDLTGEQPSEPLSATPYEEIANEQYDALQFLDTYVEDRVERLGKRPERTAVKQIVVEAQTEWLAREGFTPEEIAQVKDELIPHLEQPTRVRDSQSLSTILTEQGFSKAQRRFVRRIDVATRTAASYDVVRERLRTIVEDARAYLSDEELVPVLRAAANLEGYARFLDGKSIPVFAANAASHRLPSLSPAGKDDPKAKCIRGPEDRGHYHRAWKYGRDAILTGMTFCGWGAMVAGVGCTPMGVIGLGFGVYWQYQDAEEEYMTDLRAWCDECMFELEADASDIRLCHVKFPGDYPEGYIPDHHRD